MRKKISALCFAGVLALSLAACGEKNVEVTSSEQVTFAPLGSVETTEAPASVEVTESPEPEKMTAKKLVEEMAAALEGKQVLQTTAEMAMEVAQSVSIEGMSMEMETSMHNITETSISLEPYAAYAMSTATVDVMGESTTVDSEMYTVVEDDAVVYYMTDEVSGTWSRVDIGLTLDEMLAMGSYTGYNWMTEKNEEELILEEETELLDGQEVYVLCCTLTGEEMQMALNGTSGLEDMLKEYNLEALDYSMLVVPSVFYVDTKTFRPIKIEMEIQGMGEMMNHLMSEIMGETAEEGMEGMDMTIDVSGVTAVYTNISYDPVEVPSVPEEAYAQTEQERFNPDQGDGTYIVQESGAAVRITCPEGWMATDMSYDSLTLESNDGMVMYTMYQDTDNEDFAMYVEYLWIPQIEENGVYVSHEAGPVVDGMETIVVTCDGGNMIFVWKPVSNGGVFTYLVDSQGASVEECVRAAMALVEEYSLENVA